MYIKSKFFRKLKYALGNWKNKDSFDPRKRLRIRSFFEAQIGIFQEIFSLSPKNIILKKK